MTSPTLRRVILITVIVILWFAAAIWKGSGRPALSSDLGGILGILSNSFPSFVGGLTVPLCFLAAHPRPSAHYIRRACIWSLPVLVLAEVVEILLPGSHFDWWDISLSMLGIVIIGFALRFFWRHDPQEAH